MKGALIILFCTFALALSDGDVELNDVGCPVDPEIYKALPHDAYCNLFYSCVGGVRIEQRCPGELRFNEKEEVCDWASNVDCGGKGISDYKPEGEGDNEGGEVISPGGNGDPSLAPAICKLENSDGVLIAHENCNQFYKCDRGVPAVVDCPYGLLYNYELGVCDWSFNVVCGNRVIPQQSNVDAKPESDVGSSQQLTVNEACAKVGSNGLLYAHETCNRFYKCSFGFPVVYLCPSNLVYNIKQQYCDWQENVACGDRKIVEEEKEEEGNANENEGNANENEGNAGNDGYGHADPSEAPAICAAEGSDGVLIAHERCSLFYKCSLGVPVALDCPFGLEYNIEREYCDWPANVDCGDRTKSARK